MDRSGSCLKKCPLIGPIQKFVPKTIYFGPKNRLKCHFQLAQSKKKKNESDPIVGQKNLPKKWAGPN